MTDKNIVFVGIIASSSSLDQLVISSGYIAVQDGKITKTGSSKEFDTLEKAGEFSNYKVIKLSRDQFIIPGFVDCHTHAPQFPNIGLGLDRPLLEWLAKYTFPLEKKYSDTDFAAKVYDQVVQRLLKNGTTTACYFGSLHVDGTLELVKSAVKHRQRALIGKVSMNKENDAGYYNDTKKELEEVETFIKKVLAYQNELVEPVVTPRFAVSCDKELMDGLASIAKKYNCRIQVGAPSLPDSCMPLGMRAEDALTKLVSVWPSPALHHRLLAVSFAAGPDDDVLHSNLAGFVCVTAVDMERQTLTILSPQPRPLPTTVLLLSELQYMDNH